MLVPLSWLKDYVDVPEDLDGLKDLLTFSGLEVEGVESVGSEYEGVVVAEITEINRHPDADKLTLCTIEFGGEESMTVVCGAPNVRVGMKTMYAQLGTTLPNGLKLKKAKIRGVVSLGMLCAEDELGLGESHAGIMDLDESIAPGTPAVEVLGGPEIVFDLEVTPNRPDCLSVIGVARELAALTNQKLKLPSVELDENGEAAAADLVKVEIEDAEGCPRYTARVLGDVKIGPSPDWMQKRLRLCNLRPINNAVDITNYVMLETGQPQHAFDHSLIRQSTISVRRATAGETLNTLDGEARELNGSDLVIADAERAVAVAGVMGGQDSEIRDETSTVLLETAAFDGPSVRATAKSLSMHTDASYRFARGTDAANADWCSRRAAHLFQQTSGARICPGVVDAYPGPQERLSLRCRWQRVCDLIGVEIPHTEIAGMFERLELRIKEHDAEGCIVEIPSFRGDLIREVDLIEEVARLFGLDNIPSPQPLARIIEGASNPVSNRTRILCRKLAACGLHEATHYSLTESEQLDRFDAGNADKRIVLPNPISQDQSVLRTSLLGQMAESVGRNHAHQNAEVALFELGIIFHETDGVRTETPMLSLGTLGPVNRAQLDKRRAVTDEEAFLWLKGLIEQVYGRHELSFTPLTDPAFEPGQAASISLGDKVIGRIGNVQRELRHIWRVSGPMILAEVNPEVILVPDLPSATMKPIPTFPSMSRDVALIVDQHVTHAQVMEVVQAARPFELQDVRLFDVFESEKLGKGRKSLAYAFTYQSLKKTLTDKAVEKLHGKIVKKLCDSLGAEIVGG